MKVIIAGGRDYWFVHADYAWLDEIKERFRALGHQIEEVVHGDAPGADRCAGVWALSRLIPQKKFPADWNHHGRAAGPIRNRAMAEFVGDSGVCILFPGGRGTENMREEAEKQGLMIVRKDERGGETFVAPSSGWIDSLTFYRWSEKTC